MTVSGDPKPVRELEFQFAVTQAMLEGLELDQVLHIILSGITHSEGLNFNRAFLFLGDEGGRELRATLAMGPVNKAEASLPADPAVGSLNLISLLRSYKPGDRLHLQSQKLGKLLAGFVVPLNASVPPPPEGDKDFPLQGLVARCTAFKQPFVSNTLRAFYQPPPGLGGEVMHFSHLACIPMLLNQNAIGVILADNLYTGRDIQDDELRGLQTLANLAAIAVERDWLHRRLRNMAELDGLTGVYHRKHYELRLDQEVASARRAGRTLSLLLFDIDFFKECNEKHGHECGDRVLKDLATFLKERVRNEDVVARVGGEEFAVLLTGGATSPESLQVAEKLQLLVASRSFGGRPAGEITVSVGVTALGPEKVESAVLFRQAEEALCRAKREGRNRVALAKEG
jgi:diguanylate cyclase (GGDEF)-like protein